MKKHGAFRLLEGGSWMRELAEILLCTAVLPENVTGSGKSQNGTESSGGKGRGGFESKPRLNAWISGRFSTHCRAWNGSLEMGS